MLQQRIMLASPSRIASNLKIAGKKLIFKYTSVIEYSKDVIMILMHCTMGLLQSPIMSGTSPLGPYYIGTVSTNDVQYFSIGQCMHVRYHSVLA